MVGIIDGVMLTDAAVGHREILALLDKGVKVIGGGSMGALRAAELSDFGMLGIGTIYEEYASGRVEGDDEVVLSYDPFSLVPLSEPLINIRLNLRKARLERVISGTSESLLLSEMRKVFYPHRNFQLLIEMARKNLDAAEARKLIKFVEEGVEDFKKNDALFLLKGVKEMV